jgi:type VI secretion system secreted protein VgrG
MAGQDERERRTDPAARTGTESRAGQALGEAVDRLRPPQVPVRYGFSVVEDATATWRIANLYAHEVLAGPYACALELASADLDADPEALLGASVVVEIARGEMTRRFCGIVRRVESTGVRSAGVRLGQMRCRVHVVPALWALGQRVNSHVFQQRTVPQILAQVLAAGLGAHDRTHRSALTRTYRTREYCVQYHESDLAFVQRLMEEEGIAYYFEHDDDREVMVLVDANATYAALAPADSIQLVDDATDGSSWEAIRRFDWASELHSTSVVVRDFDWTQPGLDLTRSAHGTDDRGRDREVYTQDGAVTVGDYLGTRYTVDDGRNQATLRQEAFRAETQRGVGTSTVTGFAPGAAFTLVGHRRAELDRRYLLLEVEHRGEEPDEATDGSGGGAGAGGPSYANTFYCQPLDVPFRPARTAPRPRILGLQTATVVGPAGEEIHTDEHGRIKVQFHWDREGQRNEHSSLFVRVAQAWAGGGWGAVTIPRIGMEVVVAFGDGNPDRPLVTGCVYNGQNIPPNALPGNKTKTTLKTNSSPGGAGFNELTFEDLAGAEFIYTHAQKDYNEVVENDHRTTVHNCQSNTVDVNQTQTIGANQTERVGANQSMTVGANRTKTVCGNERSTIVRDQSLTVTGNRTAAVVGDEAASVNGNQTLSVAGNRSASVKANASESIKGDYKVSVRGRSSESVKGLTTQSHTGGRVTKVMPFDAEIVLGAKATEVIGPVHVGSPLGIGLSVLSSAMAMQPGKIELSVGGSAITIESSKITLSTGGAEVVLDGANVQVTAATVVVTGNSTVSVSSGGPTSILGKPVKINC